MADTGPIYSPLPTPGMLHQGPEEKMTGTSTPQTDSPEPLPESGQDSRSSNPLRLAKSPPDAQNKPIQIPKITTDMSSIHDPAVLVRGLEGKCVDEFGNILDWDGTVLGRVEGDLPSMVGRCVSGDGIVRDSSGDVAGHVSENHMDSSTPAEDHINKRLKIDHTGNIYDHHGAVVGRMKDHSKENKTEGCAGCRERERGPGPSNVAGGQQQSQERSTEGATDDVPRRTATPSPSDIYLDVKSTHDGIQLIIKIPTVFNRHHEGE
ncbi:LEA domain protein [Metarhizium acridum CQMa 102]|uniref:LEA domain protein n=1 Tax=Metarhizium acridum (strain CQMa 102) TaxID=655827 RepID=E9DR80_METAQ|nr:LEA domain protein [Metarhizium acridum CQMa 102]EFY93758.1 LEA domain protein [Metarhizium acridum CQMa 102]